MKQIIIKGKRNIDGMKGHKKHKRKIVDNISNKQLFKKMSQIEWLNKLYLEENYNGISFAKKEVERKIKSYKNQDIRKKIFDCEKFITPENLNNIIKQNGFFNDETKGMKFDFFSNKWVQSNDRSVNYISTFVKN